MSSRHANHLAISAGVALMLAACSATPAGTVVQSSLPVDVPEGSFYQPPSIAPATALGTILRSEPLTAPDGVRLWAILYVSTGIDGSLKAVSGLLAAPVGSPPSGGRPIVAYAHGTTGLADACAPSRRGAGEDELAAIAAPFLAAGDAVVFTDYEGLGTPGPLPYIVGTSAGRSVLDSVRAARTLAEVGAGSAVGIVGHSEGGHAALWSAQLAADYAPELDIRGVIAAAPAGDLRQISTWLAGPDSGPRAWLNALLLASAWHAVYGLPLDQAIKPEDLPLTDAVQNGCVGDITPPDSTPLLTDPGNIPAWSAKMDENSVGGIRTSAPILVLQGTADEQIPVVSTSSAVSRLCTTGDSVDYRMISGGSHSDALFAQPQLDAATAWMADRFSGIAAKSTCP